MKFFDWSYYPVGKVLHPLLALPRGSKRLMAVAIDLALCTLTVWVAFCLRLGEFVSLVGSPSIAVVLSIALALPAFHIVGLYRIAFRTTGIEIVSTVALACIGYGLCYAAIISAYALDNIPRTIGILQPILLFLAVVAVRTTVGYILRGGFSRRSDRKSHDRVVIYGAGSSGRQLASAIASSGEIHVVGFIDDDSSLHGTRINGLNVYSPANLSNLIEDERIGDVLLALPSASRRRRNEILHDLRTFAVGIRTLPGLMDLAHGRVQASDLRELTIEDLLSRPPVVSDVEIVNEKIRNRTVLVTGAGGSIGSELCRQIVLGKPARILLLEISEFALYAIHQNLTETSDIEVVPLLGSILDEGRISNIMSAWRPDIVFHAAAYKHVPLVEHNPLPGLRNNVIGTLRMAEISLKMGVTDFILVSTDKAVRPTNIMGATKRLAELVLQGLATDQKTTCFSMVRFGNVLGSSGSVVPLFREQIRRGGPITITHADITRYFMTIPEAAQLVVQASAMAKGGEVFVLDMGEPVRIFDLARNMVELSGLTLKDRENSHGDIEITTVGLRPGEKLYEELLIGDNPQTTAHPRIMMAREHNLPWVKLRTSLSEMENLIMQGEVNKALILLSNLVVEFKPSSKIVDWVTLQNAGAGQ